MTMKPISFNTYVTFLDVLSTIREAKSLDIIGEEYILRGMIPIALVNLCIRHRIGGIG